MKTTKSAKEQDIQRDWYVIDAQGQTLGRLATRVATILCGKNKPIYNKLLGIAAQIAIHAIIAPDKGGFYG